MSETALVRPDENGNRALGAATSGYSREQIDLIKDTIARGASDPELKLFLAVCQRTGLDPFSRQIYAIKRNDRDPMLIHVGVDGLRLIAERSGKWEGCIGPLFCGPDGVWKEIWLSNDPPAAAKFGVYKRHCREPIYGIALWKSSVQYTRDGQLFPIWKQRPAEMLGKCAEANCLRRAFPNETAGLTEAAPGTEVAFDAATGEILEDGEAEAAPPVAPAAPPAGAQPRSVQDACADYLAAYADAGADPENRKALKADTLRLLGRLPKTAADYDEATVRLRAQQEPPVEGELTSDPFEDGEGEGDGKDGEAEGQRELRLGGEARGPYAQQMGL